MTNKTKPKVLTIKDYNAQIDKDTRKFKKLDKAGKRVMIAQDVIKQLTLGKLSAKVGAYIDIDKMYRYAGKSLERDVEKDIRANYSKIKECSVCALGACLMSVTRFNNKLKFGDVNGSLDEINKVKVTALFKDIFSPKQLLLIECAFEGDNDGDRYGKNVLGSKLSDEQLKRAEKFYYKYNEMNNNNDWSISDDHICLMAIMENIIKNKGTFKP